MVQHNNEHPTIAQLSAYVDHELAHDELARWDAHVQTCQQCQGELADLRLTSALLRGMPQVEVPRSFVLPLNISVLPETPAHTEPRSRQSGRSHFIFKRSLRALSTIAAVIGLVFILAGAFTSLPHGGAMTSTSNSSSSGISRSAPHQSPTLTGQAAPATRATQRPGEAPVATQHPAATSIPASTPAASNVPRNGEVSPMPSVPPLLDLSQPVGRLGIGSVLFLLGLLGVLITRRLQRDEQIHA